ncbi:hypothetical protein ABZ639_10435 [Saccharomonospora sp. NPDC006951]
MGTVLMSGTPEGSSWTPVLQLKDDIYVGVNGRFSAGGGLTSDGSHEYACVESVKEESSAR